MRKFGKWKSNKDGTVLWRCNYRPKKDPCPCNVRQDGETFLEMKQHCNSCIATPGLDLPLQLLKEAKKTGTTEKELPARAIVEPLLLKLFKSNRRNVLPTIENWCRIVNK